MRMLLCILIFTSLIHNTYSQDTLTVYFLHGSKPKRAHRHTEQKWFGGKFGGHVGLAINNSNILNFLPTKGGSLFNKKALESQFILSSETSFWDILGHVDTVKSTTIKIPISKKQKSQFQNIQNNYLRQSPYDYAFFGYRCASSSYEILAQLNILKPMTKRATISKIFYPKLLRKRLLKHLNYLVDTAQGSTKRIWKN